MLMRSVIPQARARRHEEYAPAYTTRPSAPAAAGIAKARSLIQDMRMALPLGHVAVVAEVAFTKEGGSVRRQARDQIFGQARYAQRAANQYTQTAGR